MFPRNVFIIGWLLTSVAIVILIYGYYTLFPILFIGGLVLASIIAGWLVLKMDTKALIILVTTTLVMGFIDEYAHTSSGILTYFDLQTPSFLTVLGWPLFILMILGLTELVTTRINLPKALDRKGSRAVVALIPLVLIPILVIVQGYEGSFNWSLLAIYGLWGVLSLYFVMTESYDYSLFILVISVLIGGGMEYLGAFEGLWWYGAGGPLAFFLAFTWVIRTWAVLAILTLLRVRTSKSRWTLWLPSDPIRKAVERAESIH